MVLHRLIFNYGPKPSATRQWADGRPLELALDMVLNTFARNIITARCKSTTITQVNKMSDTHCRCVLKWVAMSVFVSVFV